MQYIAKKDNTFHIKGLGRVKIEKGKVVDPKVVNAIGGGYRANYFIETKTEAEIKAEVERDMRLKAKADVSKTKVKPKSKNKTKVKPKSKKSKIDDDGEDLL